MHQFAIELFIWSHLVLEFGILGCTWEWYDVTYVLHACDEQYQSFEAESESRMWA